MLGLVLVALFVTPDLADRPFRGRVFVGICPFVAAGPDPGRDAGLIRSLSADAVVVTHHSLAVASSPVRNHVPTTPRRPT